MHMNERRIFVGEKRSATAQRLDVRWEDGRLAAKTLFAALRGCGIDPTMQTYLNLYRDADGFVIDAHAWNCLILAARHGTQIVALGARVQRALAEANIPFTPLVHPAARGAIRAKATYQAHVAQMLCGQEAAA
jgi:hypothetical protein